MVINVNLGERSYDIVFRHGVLNEADKELDLKRKVFIVTDSGVPAEYAKTVAALSQDAYIYTVDQGEGSKSLACFQALLGKMLELGFTRFDCVAAVGGGVVGDLAGFTAASYMRGIDFYNIPTTVLSQIDSSIGGKNAVNLNGIKNIVGAFYQPKKVLIDPDVLCSLPPRQVSNGLAEGLKMSLTSDKELFEIFEKEDISENLDTIISRSILIKKNVVQQDEKEQGLRKILNFGHTIGHGIESEEELNGLYHGECVALGMIPMCSPEVKERLIKVLKKLSLPTAIRFNEDAVFAAMRHDKKGSADNVKVTLVDTVGQYKIETYSFEKLKTLLSEINR